MHKRVADSTSIVNFATNILYISLKKKKKAKAYSIRHRGGTYNLLIHGPSHSLLPPSGIKLHSPLKSILGTGTDCGINCGKDVQVDITGSIKCIKKYNDNKYSLNYTKPIIISALESSLSILLAWISRAVVLIWVTHQHQQCGN